MCADVSSTGCDGLSFFKREGGGVSAETAH